MSVDEPKEAPEATPEASQLGNERWVAALSTLSDEDQKRFGVLEHDPKTVVDDLLKETEKKKAECLKKRWKIKLKGKTIVLRDVLEKITVWINKFAAVATAVSAFDPVTTALPWAAFRFILQTAVTDIEIFGQVLQSVEDISNIIAVAAILEVAYLEKAIDESIVFERLSHKVVNLYAAILQYLSETLRYYSQRTATRFIKSIGSSTADFDEKFAPIEKAKDEVWELADLAMAEKASRTYESVDRLENSQREALAHLLVELQQPICRISEQLWTIQDGLERQQRAQILRSISSMPHNVHHKGARKGRLEGSGRWLLDNREFKAWRADSTSSVLWLHGIPGSGKTKLASLVVDELARTENLAFFFCMRNPAEPLRGQADAILASLVRQLAGRSGDSAILAPVVERYQDAVDGMAGFDDFAWTSDESAEVLKELLEEYPSVTLVLDALDEVNLQDRQELMEILSKLLRESPNLVKIFVSSRDNYDIALHFEGSPNIYIDAQENKADIQSFIDDRLDAAKLLRGRLDPTLRSKIVDTLAQKADGMFRWVDLQIQSLRSLKLAADVEARLGVLPTTLEDSYWIIYQDILDSGSTAADLAVFTFQWLLCAQEMIEAPEFARFASLTLSATSETEHTFTKSDIIDVCANLVVWRAGKLEFAHLSVREFLEGLSKRGIDSMQSGQSHASITAACLRLLTSSLDEEHEMTPNLRVESDNDAMTEPDEALIELTLHDNETETSLKDEKHKKLSNMDQPMSRYALDHWPKHATESGDLRQTAPLQNLIQSFLIDKTSKVVSHSFQSWCREIRDKYNPNYDPHKLLLDAGKEPANPVWLACLSGWVDIVEFLHSMVGEGFDEVRELTSYERRSVYGSTHEPGDPISPLCYAVAVGNLALTECLLVCSPDPLQTKVQSAGKPLVIAAENGDEGLVTLLLSKDHGGHDVEADALIYAARCGRAEICSILLEHNPQLATSRGPWAFVTSCRSGSLETVKLLLDKGVSIERGAQGLNFAVLQGSREILQELLERGVGKTGMASALITAIAHGDTVAAALLQEHGAEKRATAVLNATKDDTPLTAVRLIEAGFSVKARWVKTGQVALHFASMFGRDKVVAAILGAGGVVDVYDNQSQTPLHIAASRGRTDCARVLLDHGANVLAQDDEGKLPLDLAEEADHAECELLIRQRMERLRDSLLRQKEQQGDEDTEQHTTNGAVLGSSSAVSAGE